MTIIGVTGSFGSGKSYVAGVFGTLGAKVCDADKLARKAVEKGKPAYKKIVKAFGLSLLDANKDINRRALAGVVFGDKAKLKRLNRIVHPEVIKAIKENINSVGRSGTLVIDAPLLIEAGLDRIVDVLVVVRASKKEQIKRCVKKFGLKKSEVLKRIESQMDIKKKVKKADFVVNSSGTKAETRRQAKSIWRQIAWK